MIHFKAKYGIRIPSKKHDTYYLPTEEFLTPQYVYIPLSLRGNDFDVYVKAGDQVKVGQVIARRDASKGLPIVKHAPVSGEVVGMERKTHRTGAPYQAIVIKNDFQETLCETIKPFDWEKASYLELVDFILESGIVGLGGAGFPTAVKYQTEDTIDTVILNGAECEPYLTADYRMMLEETKDLFTGLKILMKAGRAERGIIAIKKNNKEVYKALKEEAKNHENISIKLLPDLYPAGWERTVVYRTTKRTYENLPSECGVIVNNVQTAIAVAKAVRTGLPLIDRVITVSGEGIISPKNIRVKVGTLATDAINYCHGLATDLGELRILAGGPMTGVAQKSTDFIITRAVNGILALLGTKTYQVPHGQPVGDVLLNILHLDGHADPHFVIDEQPCVRCMSCVKACPAGLQPTLLSQASLNKDEKELGLLDVDACINCGSCTYVCPSHISLAANIAKGKTFYQAKQRMKK